MLYTPDRQFLQVLEGEKDVVRALYYEHIVADTRHEDCYVLNEGPWPFRGFPNWQMGFVTHQFIDVSTNPGYVEISRLQHVLSLLAEAHPGLSEFLQIFVERYKRIH
ncbi:hypothetical protein GCM10022409_19590 [Hymenobacter glaciei]|uniref:BLUF domain-containing protein n=1 Tax=Hymenobacter glaciei TaxID=877209 RepID=A0ABP7U396_9BACT